MRLLIDGYNLMHAAGQMARKFKPEQFRQVRTRFLNHLADALGPIESALTTVVFDASAPPEHLPSQTSHKGLTVVYATTDPDADTRIETLIAQHPSPRKLTVVSTDHRIRQAAVRRKAQAMTADAFLSDLAERKRKQKASRLPQADTDAAERPVAPDQAEAAYWMREFADLEEDAEVVEGLKGPDPVLTEADLERLEREIEQEFASQADWLPPKAARKRPGS